MVIVVLFFCECVCLDAMPTDVDAQHETTSTNKVLAVFVLHFYTA